MKPEEQVLKEIVPSKEERQKFIKAVDSFLNKLNKNLKGAKAILGGSGEKDTWLSGSCDIDLFVQYQPKEYKSNKISRSLQKTLKKTFPKNEITTLHGSRDYFQVIHQGFVIEVIPILEISKSQDAQNITDISPLHAIWVNKHTKKLKSDIRLAKQFCKANRFYGAESYISGFSGYVLEILIAHYGSFHNLLKLSQKWKKQEVIDPDKHYPKKDALFHLNRSKTQSPLIVVDPVDKSRNASAALSHEVCESFKKVARKYLNSPSLRYLQKQNILELYQKESEKKKYHLIHLEITPKKGKEDVIGMKLRKIFFHLKKELEKFQVNKCDWGWGDKAHFYYLVKENLLPEFEEHIGPPKEMKEAVKLFKKKHKKTYENKERICTKIKEHNRTLEKYLSSALKHKYVQERISKAIIKNPKL